MGSALTAAILFRPVKDAVARSAAAVAARVTDAAALRGGGGQPSAAATTALAYLAAALDASDQIIADPTAAMFGLDAIALPGPLPGAAAAVAAAAAAPA